MYFYCLTILKSSSNAYLIMLFWCGYNLCDEDRAFARRPRGWQIESV